MRRATIIDTGLREFAIISIHALHEESDPVRLNPFDGNFLFQSTLSMRRATRTQVSTHVPLPFQSTLSMRRATQCPSEVPFLLVFQSTLSMRRATGRSAFAPVAPVSFQSTLSMRRATDLAISKPLWWTQFQSTLSMRRATRQNQCRQRHEAISIHALHEESDCALR